jgi:23S rRNA (cytosine1962-C5)-methyltransferase
MRQLRPFPQVIVTKKAVRALNGGHPWVFEGEVLRMEGAPTDGREAQNGDVVDVMDEKSGYHGTGLISLRSKIRVRVVSKERERPL